jgi:hypothetical protein
MHAQAAPGELLLFQFLMSAAFSAYNAPMWRGWLAVFAVLVLMAQGFAPCAAICHCRQMENAHECCAPAAGIYACCCANLHESSAFVPAAQKEAAIPPSNVISREIALRPVGARTVFLGFLKYPPTFESPPIVLRI